MNVINHEIQEITIELDLISKEIKKLKKVISSLKKLLNKGMTIVTYCIDEVTNEMVMTTIYSKKNSLKFR